MATGSQIETSAAWAVILDFCQVASFRFRITEVVQGGQSAYELDQNSLWRVLRAIDADAVKVWRIDQYFKNTGTILPHTVSANYDYNNNNLYINAGNPGLLAASEIIHEATHAYADVSGMRLTIATHEFLGFFVQSLYLRVKNFDFGSLVKDEPKDHAGGYARVNKATILARCAALADQLGVVNAAGAPLLSPEIYGAMRARIAAYYGANVPGWDAAKVIVTDFSGVP